MRIGRVAATCLLVVSAVAACSSGSGPAGEPRGESGFATSPAINRYVALGDSYTAAPGVGETDPANGCYRSSANYPALTARELDGAELVDRSCSGAETRDMTRRQRPAVAPQFSALDADTDLVTVGIGGNDFGLYGSLARQCLALRSRDPRGAPCREALSSAPGAGLGKRLDAIGARVADVVEGIRERSPDARIFIVGYPQIFPETGGCPRVVPLARGDVRFAADVVERLSGALARAAEDGDAEFLDLIEPSRGHDVCSDSPWISGVAVFPGLSIPLHPLPAEQGAIADLLLERLEASY